MYDGRRLVSPFRVAKSGIFESGLSMEIWLWQFSIFWQYFLTLSVLFRFGSNHKNWHYFASITNTYEGSEEKVSDVPIVSGTSGIGMLVVRVRDGGRENPW